MKILYIARNNNSKGPVADFELHFTDGALVGFRQRGFAIWERNGDRWISYPDRKYSDLGGKQRSFHYFTTIGNDLDAAQLKSAFERLVLDGYVRFKELNEKR